VLSFELSEIGMSLYQWAVPALIGVVGALIGSFLNVCIHRLPRGESIVRPRSRCPGCLSPVGALDNVPVLSFLWLGGRCRRCRAAISYRYPAVEILNGLGYILIWHRFGATPAAAVYAAFFSALLVVTFIDWDHQIIPNRITLPGIVIGLISAATVLAGSFIDAVMGAVLGGGLLYAVAVISEWFLKKEGMGLGDVKLLAMIGAFLGWRAVLVTIFIGALAGSLIGLTLMALKVRRREEPIPFGPFLALGAVAALFAGPELIAWYLRLGA
jgi:leader peptidase (prepilin peptidase)/N-methyltransferase